MCQTPEQSSSNPVTLKKILDTLELCLIWITIGKIWNVWINNIIGMETLEKAMTNYCDATC